MAGALHKPIGIQIFVQTLWCDKGSFWLVALAYANLVISMAQVDGAEYCCLTQPVKQVSNTQYREYIEPHLTVETTIINAHT